MSNNLINRDDALAIIKYSKDPADGIKNLPAVDAIPVIHAKWIIEEKEFSVMEKDGFIRQKKKKTHTCPICLAGIVGLDNMNFCPNCGAQMDGEEDARPKID